MVTNFALVGCGRIAERHAENIARVSTLSAVCDIVRERANIMAKKYNAKPYYSLQSLLQNEKEINVVSICTPNGLHASQTIECLNAGLNVLCEKPLCINSEDGKTMIAAAENASRKLYVVKQNRYNPPVAKLKEIINDNRLGKLYSFQINCFWNRPDEYYKDSWRGTKELDGGTLFTQFSHFIDLLYWMLGDVKKVKAIKKNYAHSSIEIEDAGVVILEMKNGMIGTLNYTVNAFEKNMEGSFTIFGEKGTVKIGGQYLNELEYQMMDSYKIEDLAVSNSVNDYGLYQGSMSNHDKVYDNLINALNNNDHEISNADDGQKTVEIIEKIYRSMQ